MPIAALPAISGSDEEKFSAVKMRRTIRQSLWMLLAGLLFALAAQCVKQGSASLSGMEMVMYRSAGGVILIFSIARLRQHPLRTSNPRAHLWRGLFGFTAMSLYFYCLGSLPTATAYALNYTSPIFFIIFSAVFWREPVKPLLAISLAGSFVGVLFLLRPSVDPGSLRIGLVALLSGMFAGLAYCNIRQLGILGEGGTRTVFYFTVICSVLALVYLQLWGNFMPLGREVFLPLIGLVLFATFGQLAMTQSLHHGRSGLSAVFAFSGIIFTVLLDSLLLGISFAPADYIGFALLVLCGGASMLLTQSRRLESGRHARLPEA